MPSTRDISAEFLRTHLHYDPETGVFTRLTNRGRGSGKWKPGEIAGFELTGGYRGISLNGTHYKAHRLAWLYVHGSLPSSEIDHINRIPSDNRLSNLRDVSRSLNELNKHSAQSNNQSSGLRGVSWDSQRRMWRARFVRGRKALHSSFHTEAYEAHLAYLAAKAELT